MSGSYPIIQANRRSKSRRIRGGFNLVELLVVIAIVGVLIAILLPAVQAAREAARRMQCKNHLKQLALGFITHQEQHGHFPTGGWGINWVCDPERGFDKRQPGGWGYNILPYIEQQALYELGSGTKGVEKLRLNKQRLETPLSIFHCPSRRPARIYTMGAPNERFWIGATRFTEPLTHVALTDYAANGGDNNVVHQTPLVVINGWPKNYTEGEFVPSYWPRLADFSGITISRSETRIADVSDGTSNTYLLGEKYLRSEDYYHEKNDEIDDWQWQDLNSVYSGDFYTHIRWVDPDDARDQSEPARDSDDRRGLSFGSPHDGGFHMAFCDGSVRTVSYNINYETHRMLANREDGLTIDYSTVE